MKLKRKHFARLKEIAEEINESGVFGLTAIKLNKLIADIESVQKPKTIKEEPIWDSIESKIGEGKEYKSIDDYIEKYFKSRSEKVQELMTRNVEPKEWFTNPNKDSGSPYIESLKEEARDMLFKEGKNAVENSLSDRRSTKGIRNKLRNLDPSLGRKLNGVMDVETGSDLEKFLDPLMAPQIGDIGYFWDEPCLSAVYGKLDLIAGLSPRYQVTLNGEFVRAFTHFSKTPPELK